LASLTSRVDGKPGHALALSDSEGKNHDKPKAAARNVGSQSAQALEPGVLRLQGACLKTNQNIS